MVSLMNAYIASFSFAYIFGSISSAILVCRALGYEDPRQVGSGNPGATNVLRVAGKIPAGLTLLGDALKGFIPVWAVTLLCGDAVSVSLAMIGALLGHLFPVFFQFKGGKGVATYIGTLFGLNLLLGIAYLLTWLVLAALYRISSLAALVATAAMVLYMPVLLGYDYLLTGIIIGALIFWRHQSNIADLLSGDESTFQIKDKS